MVEQALAVLALEREGLTQLLLEQVGPVEAVVDLGVPGQLGRLLVGEVFGFFHNAYRACLRSRACPPSPSLRAVFRTHCCARPTPADQLQARAPINDGDRLITIPECCCGPVRAGTARRWRSSSTPSVKPGVPPSRTSRPTLACSGRFGDHRGLLARMHLEHIDHLTSMIDELDTLIERVLAPFAQQMSLLCTIPGIGERAAQVIISENGVDMSRFPTAAHLASWAGLCPGNNESASPPVDTSPAAPARATRRSPALAGARHAGRGRRGRHVVRSRHGGAATRCGRGRLGPR